MDFYLSETGDIKLAPNRDIALTDSSWRDQAQQAYIRIQTQPGDFQLYPRLGTDLEQLFGMPQNKATGDLGVKLIQESLTREGFFSAGSLIVNAVPTGPQTIRFDVYVVSGQVKELAISIEQSLGVV